MTEAEHKKKLRSIETETKEIKRDTEKIREQIMKLESQHKKDISAADRRHEKWKVDIDKRISYIAKLAGITYEELDMMEDRLILAGGELSNPREHSLPS
ncbi:MAG: hypothetical protein ACKVQJ_15145 [Pyrinomonadaceae bacterium]